MTARRAAAAVPLAFATLGLGACATPAAYDYANFIEHPPRSILVLPPINESLAVEGTYGCLSTVSRPLAERGYYVFPVAVVDQLLKQNGMPTPGEMHGVPLDKVREVTGADAVLYPVLHRYGSQYHLVSSDTVVEVSARLVDTRTGLTLWENTTTAQQGSGGSGNVLVDLVSAVVAQAINASTDAAHGVCRIANEQLFGMKKRALPPGPYDPEFGRIP